MEGRCIELNRCEFSITLSCPTSAVLPQCIHNRRDVRKIRSRSPRTSASFSSPPSTYPIPERPTKSAQESSTISHGCLITHTPLHKEHVRDKQEGIGSGKIGSVGG